jgi:hypothetical protein
LELEQERETKWDQRLLALETNLEERILRESKIFATGMIIKMMF